MTDHNPFDAVFGPAAGDAQRLRDLGYSDDEIYEITEREAEFRTLLDAASARVSETKPPLTSGSDTSDTSDTPLDGTVLDDDALLLAGVRDGKWLDEQHFPEVRYAVRGIIPEGLTVLVGPPKAGKSWFALGVLLAVASGGRAIGTIPVGEPRRVLYLALEDGDRRMQDRCRALIGDEPIPELFHYVTRIPPGRVLDVIRAFLRRYDDTALVVIDTLGKVMPPAMPGESAYQRDYRIGSALKDVADSHDGLALVVLHHDRKAGAEDFVDSVSGTHGLAGAADTIVVLARKRHQGEGVLMVTGRDIPEAEYALRATDGVWVLEGETLAEAANAARTRAESARLSDTSTEISAYVRQHPDGVRAKDVADKFGRDAYRYLTRLEESGLLRKIKRGVYGPPLDVSELSEVSEGQLRPLPGIGHESDSDAEVSDSAGPCAASGCPETIPAGRRSSAIYCSDACSERQAKRRLRAAASPQETS